MYLYVNKATTFSASNQVLKQVRKLKFNSGFFLATFPSKSKEAELVASQNKSPTVYEILELALQRGSAAPVKQQQIAAFAYVVFQ